MASEKTTLDAAKENDVEALLVLCGAGVATQAYVPLVQGVIGGSALRVRPSFVSTQVPLPCHIYFTSSVGPLRKELIVERHVAAPPDIIAGSLYRGVGRANQNPIGEDLNTTRTDYTWGHRSYSLNIFIFIYGEYAKGGICLEKDALFQRWERDVGRRTVQLPIDGGSGSLGSLLGTSCHARDAFVFPITNNPSPPATKQKDERPRSKSTVSLINETTPLIHPTGNGNGTHYHTNGHTNGRCVQPAASGNSSGAADASHQMVDEETSFYHLEKSPHTMRFENLRGYWQPPAT
ncbi:hypothetical protein DL766_006539 [Monosporascus sp. MC13-8B]|uniref:Glucose-methanol-choline oxidoreductase N-terminal domain-containing protein n=1 Tax=Monosporascus cannonballus TaxID=155416 RepID=A0ABY0GXF8_9PEZI|nr:hypothetical protein DL763_011014 [Monosporascus cannonballus]RYO77633.1 hypothetical protein DL762_009136 [Monosporascus cannonballus]RYP27001.1 hypothetical protein DL766_006539 [Monosporascus sp. MC13-8B]